MTQSPPATSADQEKINPLIQYLLKAAGDGNRGALAEIRRGLGRGPDYPAETLKHVLRFPASNHTQEEAMLLVATLFAANPAKSDNSQDMGDVFKNLRGQTESDSIEKRFVALLNAHRDEVGEHLRHAVSLAASKDIAIGWAILLKDIEDLLSGVDWRSQRVKRKWTRSFWSRPAESN